MSVYYIGIAAMFMTYIGGFFALYFKDRLHLILGYSAGAVMGVALFDLIPEAINMGINQHIPETINMVIKHYDVASITSFVALGFALYLLVDRFISSLSSVQMAPEYAHTHNGDSHTQYNNNFAIISLIIHSILDGLAIGLAFQINIQVGIVLSLAVLLHDFSDGINTVSLSLLKDKSSVKAKKWLMIDAFMPMVGIVLAQAIQVNESIFAPILAIFAGFFLYIGASELIPESQHRHPYFWTTFMTMLGMFTLYFIIRVISI